MSGSWTSYKLGDLFELKPGYAFKGTDFVNSGAPVLKIKNVKAGQVVMDSLSYVDPAFLLSKENYKVAYGDLLITMSGNRMDGSKETWVGKVAQFRLHGDFLLNQRVGKLIPKDCNRIDARFASYVLSSDQYQDYLISVATSSGGQANISPDQILSLEMPLPTIGEQKAISHILGTLDDKIELNRKMNETLESMARALFESWFIDFDPVRAKMDGRWKKGQSLPGLPAELWDLFPVRLAKSENGEIPEGWSFRTLAQSSEVVMGQSPPGESYNETGEGIVFYQGRAEFGFRYPSPRLYCTEPTRFAERGAILLSVRAPVGDLNIADQRIAIGRGLAAIKHRQGGQSFTYYLLKGASSFFEVFDGEGTVFGSINKDALVGMKHIEPSAAVLEKYLQIVEPIDERIEGAEIDSTILRKTRNALLPRLISGELKLNDASRFLQERGL